jgi:hypothetical protein
MMVGLITRFVAEIPPEACPIPETSDEGMPHHPFRGRCSRRCAHQDVPWPVEAVRGSLGRSDAEMQVSERTTATKPP